MDSLNLNKHISGQFNAELESIRTQVMTMGGMAAFNWRVRVFRDREQSVA